MKLGDICQIRYGKDHKGLIDGSIPAYGSGGVMRYVDRALWDKPSVLIPRKGTLENLFFVDQPFWTVDTLFWTEIDESKVLPKFLYYTLRTKNLAELNVGTAVPSLTTKVLNEVEVEVPSLDVQARTVALLSSFDDAAALNNRTNDYLLGCAKAIFEHWLTDADGPLGPISKIALLNPDTYSTKERWSLVQYLDTGSIMRGDISEYQIIEPDKDKLPSRARRKVKSGDIVYSTVRPNQKHYGILLNPEGNVLVSTGFAVVREIGRAHV